MWRASLGLGPTSQRYLWDSEGPGWVRLDVANPVTVAPSPHPLRTGPGHPGHPVRGGRWAGPSNSENGSDPLAGALFIFIFILSRRRQVFFNGSIKDYTLVWAVVLGNLSHRSRGIIPNGHLLLMASREYN